MDKLKQLVASKRKAVDEDFGGKKFVKRGELEEMKLKKLREEEEQERIHKEQIKKEKDQQHGIPRPSSRANIQDVPSTAGSDQIAKTTTAGLSREEVMRRLRVLKEPATLFGETDDARRLRLALAERNIHVEDEAAGGQQGNLHTTIARESKERAKMKSLKEDAQASGKPPSSSLAPSAPAGPELTDKNVAGEGGDAQALAPVDPEQQQLMASFQAAADAVAEKNTAVEDRVTKWLKKWMKDWAEDLDARSSDVKASGAGRQADVRFKETQEYMRPLYSRLRNRCLDPQLLAGIKLIVDAMKDRNYLHAYKIYMGVAVGNSPWPIGVTQVGLHERASREKISFKYASGSAHIMNDEASRKFIQALKRLMTFCQRRYPTDPSRSVDFDGGLNEGRGSAGGGSDKQALLAAMSRGEVVAPAPAPSYFDAGGTVKIPEKWDQVIKQAMKEVAASDAAEEEQERQDGRG